MTSFDTIVSRRNTNSLKWEEAGDPDVLPLWVADMDFLAAPCIREALRQRVEHGVFGYSVVPDTYYEAIIQWFRHRHHWTMDRQWILYTTGVVPAISCVIKAIAMPGDKVLLTTPVYNCFFSSVRNNGCEVLTSPLQVGSEGKYEINWTDFETKCADPKTVAYILCNPHNPGGRVWKPEELQRIGEICRRHHVWVVSDEIHNELVMPGYTYTPFASVCAENQMCSVTCISPSKSFNIAGLQIANIVCEDGELRRRIDRAININEVCDVNPFGIVATIAAYSEEGELWLQELQQYLSGNYQALLHHAAFAPGAASLSTTPAPVVMPLEGTYLVWVNVESLCQRFHCDVEQLTARLLHEAKVYFNPGTMYGDEGRDFLRINIACPRAVLTEALDRFSSFIAG